MLPLAGPFGVRPLASTVMARLMLIDGNSLTYRAFFALPTDMATAAGQVTNAVYGFTSMLVNLIKDHHPDQVVAASTGPNPTFRHQMIGDYKAGRAETPDILRQQMGLVRQLVETLKIPILEMAGFEADDVLATLATQARRRAATTSWSSPATGTAYQLVARPPRQGPLQPPGRVRLRPLRRGRHRGPHGCHAGAVPAVRRAAR